ncbi:hypothetical protein QYF36_022883 [Acer negundo]|nr:hypothetical protein QYF36_022883 [Acer negundo]
MKEHLAGIQGNVVPCTRVTPEVREEIKTYMLANENAKKKTQLMREERIDNCVTLNNLSKKGSSSYSVTERGIRGSMDRFVVNVKNDAVEDLGLYVNLRHLHIDVNNALRRAFASLLVAFNYRGNMQEAMGVFHIRVLSKPLRRIHIDTITAAMRLEIGWPDFITTLIWATIRIVYKARRNAFY